MKQLDRYIQRWRIRKAAAFIEPGASVLDIGCADGALFRLVPRLGDSIGIDPDLDRAETPLPHVRLYPGLFPDALPEARQFDAIVMLAVLEHIPVERIETLARDCAAHLKPGGRLIITVPAPAVDHILAVLKALRLIDGMSLEQHHGFEVASTPGLFIPHGFALVVRKGFQLGLNTLFVFERNGHAKRN